MVIQNTQVNIEATDHVWATISAIKVFRAKLKKIICRIVYSSISKDAEGQIRELGLCMIVYD